VGWGGAATSASLTRDGDNEATACSLTVCWYRSEIARAGGIVVPRQDPTDSLSAH
jgi:hypothetical protein